MNNDYQYDDEISLKELIMRLYKKRKFIVILSIIFSVLAISFSVAKYVISSNSKNEEESIFFDIEAFENIDLEENKNNDDIILYNIKRSAMVDEIKTIQSSLETKKDFNENSITMKIDPNNKEVINLSYAFKYNFNEEVSFENWFSPYKIITTYMSFFQRGEYYNYLLDNLSTEISMQDLTETIAISPDYSSNIINISIFYPDSEINSTIQDLTKDYFNITKNKIDSEVISHEMLILNESKVNVFDAGLEERQNNNYIAVSQLSNELTKKADELKKLKEPKDSSLKRQVVLYGAIGFILGMMLAVFIVFFYSYMKDTINNEDELKILTALPIIGTVPLIDNDKIRRENS